MIITEVCVELVESNPSGKDRLRAYCSVTFDDMLVLKCMRLIEGPQGLFIAMPDYKHTDRCPNCGAKNHLRSRFCNGCGGRLDEKRAAPNADGRVKLHADIVHPINSECRWMIQDAVLAAYADELRLAREPGYTPRHDSLDADHDEMFKATTPGVSHDGGPLRNRMKGRS